MNVKIGRINQLLNLFLHGGGKFSVRFRIISGHYYVHTNSGYTVTFTAATALIPARVYEYIRGNTSLEVLANAWERSLQILRRLSCLSPSAVACLAALQMLNEELVVEESQSQNRQNINSSRAEMDVEVVEQNQVRTSISDTNIDHITGRNDHDTRQLQAFSITDPLLQVQDFGWLEYLSTDLLTNEFTDLNQYSNVF